MRDRPAAALLFLIGLTVIPAAISYAVVWSVLRYTNTGLLVYKTEAARKAGSEDTDLGRDETMLSCSYFTGTAIFQREFPSRQKAQHEAGGCPWRIEVS